MLANDWESIILRQLGNQPSILEMLPLIVNDEGVGMLFRHCLEYAAVFRFLDGSSERRGDERNADLARCFRQYREAIPLSQVLGNEHSHPGYPWDRLLQ